MREVKLILITLGVLFLVIGCTDPNAPLERLNISKSIDVNKEPINNDVSRVSDKIIKYPKIVIRKEKICNTVVVPEYRSELKTVDSLCPVNVTKIVEKTEYIEKCTNRDHSYIVGVFAPFGSSSNDKVCNQWSCVEENWYGSCKKQVCTIPMYNFVYKITNYETKSGNFVIQPILTINNRYTVGLEKDTVLVRAWTPDQSLLPFETVVKSYQLSSYDDVVSNVTFKVEVDLIKECKQVENVTQEEVRSIRFDPCQIERERIFIENVSYELCQCDREGDEACRKKNKDIFRDFVQNYKDKLNNYLTKCERVEGRSEAETAKINSDINELKSVSIPELEEVIEEGDVEYFEKFSRVVREKLNWLSCSVVR